MSDIPDAKALVMSYLAGSVSCPVVSKRPDGAGAPTEFVRVIATGGPGRTRRALNVAQVTIDCYAASTGRAMQVGLLVDALMHALPKSPHPVGEVSGSFPAEMPDATTASPRVTATYQLTTRLS